MCTFFPIKRIFVIVYPGAPYLGNEQKSVTDVYRVYISTSSELVLFGRNLEV